MTDEIREIERQLTSVNDIISKVNAELVGVRVYETLNSLARVKYELENELSEAKTIYNEGRMNYPDSALQGVVTFQYKGYTFVPIETCKAVSYKDTGRVLLIRREDGFLADVGRRDRESGIDTQRSQLCWLFGRPARRSAV